MMELLALEHAPGVAMRVDVHKADWPVAADRAQNRVGDRMVAANRKRGDTSIHEPDDELFDVLVARLQIETAPEGHVANVCDIQFVHRRAAESIVVGADALDRAQRARTEPRAAAVCDTKVHRDTEERDLKVLARRFPRIPRESRRVEERWKAGIGKRAAIPVRKDEARDAREFRILRRVGRAGSELFKLFPRPAHLSIRLFEGCGLIGCRPRRSGAKNVTRTKPKRFGNILLKKSDVKPQRNARFRKAIRYSGRSQTGPRFPRHRFTRPEWERESERENAGADRRGSGKTRIPRQS